MSSPVSGEWKHVPQGWQTTEPGYWGTMTDGRDTLEMVLVYREERDSWRRAFEAAQEANRTFHSQMEARFDSLERSVETERAAWKKELRKARSPGFGLFTGFGVDHRGEGNWVIGAGLVWRVW